MWMLKVAATVCLCIIPMAQAWSCGLTLDGDPDHSANLTLARFGLHCAAEKGDVGTELPVGISSQLTNRSLTGVKAQQLPPGRTDTLIFFQQANITFAGARVSDINTTLNDILRFEWCPFVTFTDFRSTRCTAVKQLLNVTLSQGDGVIPGLVIEHSSFTDGIRGLSITYSYANVSTTQFSHLNGNGYEGGAMYVDNTNGNWLGIHNCNFSNNAAPNNHAGALRLKSAASDITDSHFINNTNGVNGAAILLDGDNSDAWFVNCLFANNTAGFNAAFYAQPANNATLVFKNTTFFGNVGYQGGAISAWESSYLAVDGCHFEANSAIYHLDTPGDGAAMYVTGYQMRATYLFVVNTKFVGNNASASPGASIVNAMECQCVGMMNNTFEDNLGVALAIDDTQGECTNLDQPYAPLFNISTVTDNGEAFLDKFTNESPILGWTLSIDIRNTTFTRNVDSSFLQPLDTKDMATYLRGGAGLSMKSTRSAILVDLRFEGNMAYQGGAVLLDTCLGTIIWRGQFHNNTATQGGGAIASVNNLHFGGLAIGETTITGNKAQDGGGVYGTDSAQITITNSTRIEGNTAVANGGGAACVNCLFMTMQLGVSLEGNQAGMSGGGCYTVSTRALTLNGTQYTGNWAAKGGAVYVSGLGTSSVTQSNITNSTFVGNAANVTASGGGGALYLDGGVTLINSSIFQQNNATGFGGALAYNYECFPPGGEPVNVYMWAALIPPVGSCSVVRSTNDSFINNYASSAGGAVYATDMASLSMICPSGLPRDNVTGCEAPAWQGNSVNTTGYGAVMAYSPATIVLNEPYNVTYTSDGTSPLDLIAWVMDIAGQNVTIGVSPDAQKLLRASVGANATLNPPASLPNPSLPGETTGNADVHGMINMSQVLIVAEPWIYNMTVTLPAFPLVPGANKLITIQACTSGEYRELSQPVCSTCLPSTFSLNPKNHSCDPCPEGAQCFGGEAFIPPQGKWQSDPRSTSIVNCPNAEACGGNRTILLDCKQFPGVCNMTRAMDADDPNSYMMKMCKEGYYGPVCSLCTLHNAPPGQDRYGRTGTLQCKPCRKASTIVLTYIASTVLVMLWLTFTIHVTLRQNMEDAGEADNVEGKTRPARVSEFLKAAQQWLQYITLLAGVNIPTPRAMHWVFSAANFAFSTVTSGSLSTDCLLSAGHNTALQRILVHLFVPPIVLVLMLLLQIIWWASTLKQPSLAATTPRQATAVMPSYLHSLSLWQTRLIQLRSRMLVTFLSVLFYYYPSLLTTILSLFSCFRIDHLLPGQLYPEFIQATSERGYWVADMRFQCFEGWHLRLATGLGAPLIVLGCVVIPLLPVALLLAERGHLNTAAVKLRLGFLFCNYRPRFWFWESVVLVQTLGLAAAQVFANTLDSFFQVIIMLVILGFGTIALAYLHPLDQWEPQLIQVLGMVAVTATAVGCTMFLDDGNVISTVGSSAIAILLLILNVAFLIAVAYMTIKYGRSYIVAFWSQGKRIVKAAWRATVAFPGQVVRSIKAGFGWCVNCCLERPRNQGMQRPGVQMAPVPAPKAQRSQSMQPMLSIKSTGSQHSVDST